MMTISLANFTNNFFYNERSVLKNDSHYINISLEPEYEMENTEYYRSVRGFFEKYFISGEYSDVFKSGGGKLLLYYDGFNQLNSMEVEFKDMSYVASSGEESGLWQDAKGYLGNRGRPMAD